MKNRKNPSCVIAILFIAASILGIYYEGLIFFPDLCLYPQMDLSIVWCWIMNLGYAFLFIGLSAMLLMGVDIFIIRKRERGYTSLSVLQIIAFFSFIAGLICALFSEFPLNLTLFVAVIPALMIMGGYTAASGLRIKELKNNVTLAAIEAGAIAVIIPVLFFAGVTVIKYRDVFVSNQSITESNDFKNFSAECFDGTVINQDYFKEHKVTMVNCWETICSPCIRELPDLQQEYEERFGDDFAVVGICSDLYRGGEINEDTLNDAKEIIAENKVEYPIIIPTPELMQGVIRNITVFPTTFFVDSQGNTFKVVMGSKEKSAWDEVIDNLLK